MRKVLVCIVLILSVLSAFSQQKYWIFFNDKDTTYNPELSDLTLQNRKALGLPLKQISDLKVNQLYVNKLRILNIEAKASSKWLNAMSAYLTDTQLAEVRRLAFVKSVEPIKSYLIPTSKEPVGKKLATAIDYMSGQAFINAQLNGAGVKIGVIDASFEKADIDSGLTHIFKNNRILKIRDFVDKTRNPLEIITSKSGNDVHGTEVLNNIAGWDKLGKGIQYGLATESQFYLARTEDIAHESRIEEDYWIQAIEWLDSLGVRLVSTSLGYATDMDNSDENYQLSDINGKTSKISIAAQMAVKQKGMIVVVAAGNEGNKTNWRILTCPADAQDVIAVGAVYPNWLKAGYSSLGPEALPYLKPDVSTFSLHGTSFSAPAVTGFIACILQKAPLITSDSLKKLLLKSSHLYPFGNNFVGYGVPQADVVLKLIENPTYEQGHQKIRANGESITIDIDQEDLFPIIAFHKKDKTNVLIQEELKPELVKGKRKFLFFRKIEKRRIIIPRKENVKYTTLQMGFTVFEFEW